ncbi:MAG TPA: tetratricopeptide repeat protein [Steroidobacteraceae bacterium]|nr:tetratricopeptide repeat protein [Steroidobacteraceae bacterium]
MRAATRTAVVPAALALAGCMASPPVPPPATTATLLSPAELVAAVHEDTERLDHARDAAERARWLATAAGHARQCVVQAAEDGACHYAQAQVLGLTARERPLQANSLLKDMLVSLARAEALDPALEHAGPARLTAIVLLRAPGWPLGPGDADAAVAAARRAVDRDPAYPPNLITLAQAQARTDAADQARSTFGRARLAVQAWSEPGNEPAQWRKDVEQGLRELP